MEEILFETLNFCRICLRENDDLKCIFTATVNSVELPKIIMSLAPIFILENDGLSAKVCTDCQEKVDSAYKLQKLCVQSDKNQREMLYLPAVEDVDAIKIETETVNVNSEINFEIRYCNENDNVAKAHYSKATDDVNLLVKAGPLEIRDKIEQLYKNKTVRPPKFPVAKIVNVTRNTRVPERIKKPLPSIPPKKTYDTSKSSCDICCKTFFNLASLKRHKLTDVHNSSKRTLKCPVCPKMFVTMPVYKRHLDFHGIVKALKYNCKYCPKSYDTKQAIGSHYKIHYKEFGHQKYYCDNCPKSFDKLCFLSIHMRKHMVLKFRCNTCYALFADQESLDEHGLKHEGVKYTCDICGKEFKYSLHLRMHKRRHTSLKEFLCPHCGMYLKNSSSWRQHIQRHDIGDEKNFICKICPGKFSTSIGLSAHMKYHSEEKSFKCDRLNCDAAFKNKYSLKNHIKTHLNVRKHECKNCDKKFMKADHLRRHERCHTGEKPFACKYCDRCYAQSNDLVKHTRIHIGENTYECEYCPEAFRLQSLLKEHWKTHIGRFDELKKAKEAAHATNNFIEN